MKTMKKNVVAVDMFAQTITITKAYYKRACTYGTSEYYEFRTIMNENAGFAVAFKTVEKKTYKDLTFERMAEYIETQPNSEKQLITFAAVQKIAEKKGSKYPLTKKWFLKTYPEYKENEVSAAETVVLEAELAALEDEDNDTIIALPTAVNK